MRKGKDMNWVKEHILCKLSDSGFNVDCLEAWKGDFKQLPADALKQLREEILFYPQLLALSEALRGTFDPLRYQADYTLKDVFKATTLTKDVQEALTLVFGECDTFEQAGYLLPNGSLLDFSDGGHARQDHRAITVILEELVANCVQSGSTTSGVKWMENNGALRIQKSGFETATPLTNAQIRVVNEARKSLSELYVDVVINKNHNVNPVSRTFQGHDSMNAIKAFIDMSMASKPIT